MPFLSHIWNETNQNILEEKAYISSIKILEQNTLDAMNIYDLRNHRSIFHLCYCFSINEHCKCKEAVKTTQVR